MPLLPTVPSEVYNFFPNIFIVSIFFVFARRFFTFAPTKARPDIRSNAKMVPTFVFMAETSTEKRTGRSIAPQLYFPISDLIYQFWLFGSFWNVGQDEQERVTKEKAEHEAAVASFFESHAFYLGDKKGTWSNPVEGNFVKGPYHNYSRFTDENEMNTFAHDIDNEIRNWARDIYVFHKSGRISDLQRNDAYRTVLLPRVEMFEAQWGAKWFRRIFATQWTALNTKLECKLLYGHSARTSLAANMATGGSGIEQAAEMYGADNNTGVLQRRLM